MLVYCTVPTDLPNVTLAIHLPVSIDMQIHNIDDAQDVHLHSIVCAQRNLTSVRISPAWNHNVVHARHSLLTQLQILASPSQSRLLQTDIVCTVILNVNTELTGVLYGNLSSKKRILRIRDHTSTTRTRTVEYNRRIRNDRRSKANAYVDLARRIGSMNSDLITLESKADGLAL